MELFPHTHYMTEGRELRMYDSAVVEASWLVLTFDAQCSANAWMPVYGRHQPVDTEDACVVAAVALRLCDDTTYLLVQGGAAVRCGLHGWRCESDRKRGRSGSVRYYQQWMGRLEHRGGRRLRFSSP